MTEAIEAHLEAARLAQVEGRTVDARNGYARAASLARESARPLLRAHALRHLSDIDREGGQASEALAHAEQAAALYRANGETEPLDLANSLRLKALALTDLRRLDQATRVWIEARDLYAAAGVAVGVAECEARLSPAPADED